MNEGGVGGNALGRNPTGRFSVDKAEFGSSKARLRHFLE